MTDEEFDVLWTSCDWRQEIDRMRAAITALADTELKEIACIGSDAPVEDALGRLFALVPNAPKLTLRKIKHQPFFTLRTTGKVYPVNPWPKAPNA